MSAADRAEAELVLVSGGARGITARCVVELARHHGWRFILLGRTRADAPLPAWVGAGSGAGESEIKRRLAAELAATPGRADAPVRPQEIQRAYEQLRAQLEIGATLRAVAAGGGTAEYVCVDVADPALGETLEPVIDRHGGRVAGIIHAAGVLADRRIEHKRAADFDSVFAPKVHGLRRLLAAVELEELRFVALFSSAAAYYGNAGQADYALANELLNKAAYRLAARLPRCRVVAFDWGPWAGGTGMVSAELAGHFEAAGVALVPPEAGARIVADVLAPSAAPCPTQLLVGSPMALASRAPAAPGRTHRITRRLREASNPFLRDHVIGGRPVLPVTCAMAWIAEGCEARYPGYNAVRLEDCRVLGGVVFDGQAEHELCLELTEATGSTESGEVRLRAEVVGRAANCRPRPHYRAEVVLAPGRPDPPRGPTPSFGPADTDTASRATLYRDGTLFHGPAFRGARRVLAQDGGGLVLECRLPALAAATQGQFRTGTVNPYVADALFQGLVVWVRRTRGAASLPVRTARADLYRPLEFDSRYAVSVTVRESNAHRVVADVTAADESGSIHLRLSGAEVAVSPRLTALFVPSMVA